MIYTGVSFLGRLPMKILSSCSRLLDKSNSLKFFSTALDPKAVVLFSLLKFQRRRRPLVSRIALLCLVMY
jgi:hypothetical protein